MRLVYLAAALSLLNACSPLIRQCEPSIPPELTQPLHPLREADSAEDIMRSYLHNMESCGVCYSRYRALTDAVQGEEE